MKSVRLALAAALVLVPVFAFAQWHYLDKDGRKVFSDQAPPPDVPASRILKQPGGRAVVAREAAPAAAPASAPTAAASAAPGRDKGLEKALEDKRKQAESAAAEKKKVEEERVAAAKADNCRRAREGKNTLGSGIRMARVNDKGEREILDDNQRAAETARLQAVIDRDCAKPQ
jgi:hypothetical protein